MADAARWQMDAEAGIGAAVAQIRALALLFERPEAPGTMTLTEREAEGVGLLLAGIADGLERINRAGGCGMPPESVG